MKKKKNAYKNFTLSFLLDNSQDASHVWIKF